MGTMVNVYDAKTQLSQLLSRVESGEEFVIARNGKPIARLMPLPRREDRTPGLYADQIRISDDFDSHTVGDDNDWYGA
ncbi:MAG: type II toxin-antitoxin system Phd/YefM family antitoxin [Rhodoglobus sp.]